MEAAEQEALLELVDPASVPATPAAESSDPPKRTRKRRTNASAAAEGLDAYEAAEGDLLAAPKPAATRSHKRQAKLTGSDIAGAVELASGLYAMFTKQAHWAIPAAEVKPWGDDAAQLLNRIPSKYVRAATDLSGYATVAIGIYGAVKPRVDYSADLRREQLAIKRAESMQATPADPLTSDIPWGG